MTNRNNQRRPKRMPRLGVGTTIQVDMGEATPEYASIIHPAPSEVSENVYLVRWRDGTHTLFDVKEENLIKTR